MIRTAMILAAGRGERMRPLTDTTPKPLLEVAGRSMLDRILDQLEASGVDNIVVNAHHLGQQIVDRVGNRARVVVEDRLLDTGGGVKNALPLLGDEPFMVINGDGLWRPHTEALVHRFDGRWDPERMDAILLLQPLYKMFDRDPADRGDYFIEPRGLVRHRGQAPLSPYAFASMSVCSADMFRDSPDVPFSLRLLWDRAERAGRLAGMIHEGDWFHIGTPQALAAVDRHLQG